MHNRSSSLRKFEVVCKAPVRIDFSGGPSDVIPYSLNEGGIILNGAISCFVKSSIAFRKDSCIRINNKIYKNVESLNHDGNYDLIKSIIKGEGIKQGLNISVESQIPFGSGLGSSGAISVSFLAALTKLRKGDFDQIEVAKNSQKYETLYFGIHEGGQDQYSSALGGINLMKFDGENIVVDKLILPSDYVKSVVNHLLLCYCGDSRSSDRITKAVINAYKEGVPDTISALTNLKNLAIILKDCFLKNTLEGFDTIINEIYLYQKKLHHSVISPAILNCIKDGLDSGANSGKVVGAGGGGCVLFQVDSIKKEILKKLLQKKGYQTIPFHFTSVGVKTL